MSAYEYWHVQVEFTAGTWTEVTSDVDGAVRSTNGATAETTGEAASFSLVLRNVGFRYTPGNTQSATALATGMRIRFFEVILDQYIYHFTGFIEFPEIDSVNLSMTQDQTIAVSAVDQLTYWERSSTFVSTLTEYIRYTYRSVLSAWWPLNDNVGSSGASIYGRSEVSGVGPLVQVTNLNDAARINQLVWADVAGPLGDDSSYVKFAPIAGTSIGAPRLVLQDFSIPLVAGQVVAVGGWAYVPTDAAALGFPTFLVRALGGTPNLYLDFDPASGWGFSVFTSAGSIGPIRVSNCKRDGWTLVIGMLDVTSGAVTLCVDAQTATGSLGGASTGALERIAIDAGPSSPVDGKLSWGQARILSGTGITASMVAAEFLTGYGGLERQTTGDRIKTLARYAGLTDGQLTKVDTGCSIMQTARLAGQTVAQAMYDARDTEQGDLFIDGAGNLTFHDRRTILNI